MADARHGHLKRMPIYADQRVDNEIKELLKDKGTTPEDAHWEETNVTPNDVYACSSMHYHVNGEKPTDALVRIIGTRKKEKKELRILDLGSGYGGMARVLPTLLRPMWNAHVVAVEVQPSLHDAAEDITKRLGAANDVTHVNADACDADGMREILSQHGGEFDLCCSVLVLLHLTETQRAKALANLRTMLGAKKMLYIEDYFSLDPSKLTERQRHNLDALVVRTHPHTDTLSPPP